jgi:carbamate kinase
VVSQTVVDAGDPAFADPTKFIGQAYDRGRADALAAQNGWVVKQDGGVWRRVVPSPSPSDVVELGIVETLLDHGATVVVGGGGGIPVVRTGERLRGVEAVVDKDLVAGLVARQLRADLLVIVTDVPAVIRDYGTPSQEPIGEIALEELEQLQFPAGSMGPKVQAVAAFVRATGHRAAIGSLDKLAAVVAGTVGTQVSRLPTGSGS